MTRKANAITGATDFPAKRKQAMGISKMPPFCLDRQYVLSRLISLTVLPTGIGSKTDHL